MLVYFHLATCYHQLCDAVVSAIVSMFQLKLVECFPLTVSEGMIGSRNSQKAHMYPCSRNV